MAVMAQALGHELNNTLAAMALRLEILHEDVPKDSPARESLTVLDAATRQGVALVSRVRDLARLARPLAARPVALADVIDDAVAAAGLRRLGTPGVELVTEQLLPASDRGRHDPPTRRLTVVGDRGELTLAVRELIENALDAVGDTGHVRVETDMQGRHVVGRVIDDGPGVAPDALAHAFDPFFTTRGVRGRGLGLTIALAIALRHGGDLRLAPGPRGGCVATLELPAR
jgi:signal transduction histidine kinase